ncbi:MAG: recombinase RecA [Candidatus Moranbacteria bacterium]|nr:recombinase RecA [Candidatus Moranbacteria bacterium]
MANIKNKEMDKKVDNVVSEIREKFGEGIIMKLGDVKKVDVESIPTGSISLDLALGIGGIPRGRAIEIYGPESSGKTTLTLHLIANLQKTGGVAAFVDAEHALDPEYARKIGVNINDLLISQPDYGEQALDVVDALASSGQVGLIVVDSVAALVPKAEIEGDMGDHHVGRQARLMSQALRKITPTLSKTNCTVIFINQIRMKIGVMFGNPETTTGGEALKFYSSVRIEVRRSAQIKKGEDIVGNRTKIKVVKNKVAPPFKTTEFDIMYNEGISSEGDVLDTGVKYEVVTKKGNSYSFGEEKLGVGREAAKAYLKGQKGKVDEIAKKIMEKTKEIEAGEMLPEASEEPAEAKKK